MKAPSKNKQPQSKFKLSVFSITAILAIGIMLIAAWVEIQASSKGQPLPYESDFHSPFFLPFVLTGGALLFVCGVTLILRALKHRSVNRRLFILTLALGTIFMAPGLYYGYAAASPFVSKTLADRIISDDEASLEVFSCKAKSIKLEQDPAQKKQVARIYHQDASEADGVKSNYDYRSFRPEYFGELFNLARSKEIREKCGHIRLNDLSRESLPPTVKWARLEEAKDLIDTCSIETILTKMAPRDRDTNKANEAQDLNSGMLLYLVPTPEGYMGSLNITRTSETLRSAIVDYATKAKGSCLSGGPFISEQTN